jgi:hypothetical protein
MRRVALMVTMFVLGAVAWAQATLPITEKIEWTWTDRPDSPAAALPNVLLVGDSITRGYYPATAKELDGVANV